MSFYTNTVLTNIADVDTENIVFDKVAVGSIPNSTMTFKRINIGIRNEDGSIGECIIPTEKLFSFGVQESKDMTTNKVNGYQASLSLWSRDGPTENEKAFTDVFSAIVDKCKDYILSDEGKDQTEKYDVDASDLKKLNPLYWKKEKGVIVPGTGPTLYCKLTYSKKDSKILTEFSDAEGNDIDPLTLMNARCHMTAAIKFESIFIGNKISLQIKMYEAEVEVMQTGRQRLLRTTRPKVMKAVEKKQENVDIELSDDEDETIQTKEEEDDEETPKKKVVRRKK